MHGSLMRTRWAAFGAAVAVALGGGAMWVAEAAPAPVPVEFVAITPCRLMAARPSPFTVGSRSTPLAATETYTAAVWGTNGNCTIPSTATAVSMNVTTLVGTASSNLTVFPADVARPGTSNLNWRAGDGATPNAVTVGLSADGRVSFYNAAGTVQVIADIVGYYKVEAEPAQVVTVATSGADFTSLSTALASITDASATKPYIVEIAPGVYTEPVGVDVKSFVDIRGSGMGVTTIECACGSDVDPVTGENAAPGAVLRIKGTNTTVTISDLTIRNVGTGSWADGIDVVNVPSGRKTLRNLSIAAGFATTSHGVYVDSSSVTMQSVSSFGGASAAAGGQSSGLYLIDGAAATVDDSTLEGFSASDLNAGVLLVNSAATLTNVTTRAGGGSQAFGVFMSSDGIGVRELWVSGGRLIGATGSLATGLSDRAVLTGTWLYGSVQATGPVVCVGALDALALTELNAVCL